MPRDKVESVRLFIALELPPPVQDTLQALQSRLRPLDTGHAIRWTAVSSIHLTLKFVGDTPSSNVDPIQAALIKAVEGHHPFDLEVNGVGSFPDAGKLRIVWASVGGMVEALRRLRDSVERFVAPLGYPTENRPFSPHLTIGRARKDASSAALAKFGGVVQDFDPERLVTWRAERLSLMKSDLKPDGAVYTALAEIPLT